MRHLANLFALLAVDADLRTNVALEVVREGLNLNVSVVHLAKQGFGDIEVNMSGGYDPTSTPRNAAVIRAQEAVYRRWGIDPILLPPGTVITFDDDAVVDTANDSIYLCVAYEAWGWVPA